jgi:hypothetical protein
MNIMDYLPLANVLMGNGLIAGVMVWANGEPCERAVCW